MLNIAIKFMGYTWRSGLLCFTSLAETKSSCTREVLIRTSNFSVPIKWCWCHNKSSGSHLLSRCFRLSLWTTTAPSSRGNTTHQAFPNPLKKGRPKIVRITDSVQKATTGRSNVPLSGADQLRPSIYPEIDNKLWSFVYAGHPSSINRGGKFFNGRSMSYVQLWFDVRYTGSCRSCILTDRQQVVGEVFFVGTCALLALGTCGKIEKAACTEMTLTCTTLILGHVG